MLNSSSRSSGVRAVWLPLLTVLCVLVTTGLAELYLSNLTPACMRCLCRAATSCDLSESCGGGYCGPFRMSRLFWIDGDKEVLPQDDPERATAWQDCAINYNCASRTVTNYIQRYGRDCNGDSITDCDDYAMINGNGGVQCDQPLNRSDRGRAYLARYNNCRLDTSQDSLF